MKTLLAAALALTVLAPTAAARADSPACDVSVQFGSYAMGIDGRAFEKVQRYIARHPRLILTSSVMSWGREGEKTVCLTAANGRAGATIVFRDIKALVGKGRRGPVEVRTLDGRVWRSHPGTGR